MSEKTNVISFDVFKGKRQEQDVFDRWINFYSEKSHDELLEALMYEHDNDFPLRASSEKLDQLRHKALVSCMDQKAQTDFLKNFLTSIK